MSSEPRGIHVRPVGGIPEIEPGMDLGGILSKAIPATDLRAGDVVAVTQKIVSKAEGRLVRTDGDRSAWVERETRRVVARRDDLVIAETAHGFVCANAGVDASNVAEGWLSLLPEDPDASAGRLRERLSADAGAEVGVVVTDTFGRAWRRGVVDIAIGCAGLPAMVDLRGEPDHTGRMLEATVVALADQVAAAAGLVMGKAARIPVAVVRGVSDHGAPASPAREIVRPPEEDLFRESPLQSISARRTIRAFGSGRVSRAALQEAVRAACTAPAPHHTRPWLFAAITSEAAKRRLLAAMAAAWRADLERDGAPEDVISRRIAKSDAVLGAAPVLVVPAIRLRGSHRYPDPERATAERDMFILSGGAAIQSLLLALHAQGLASSWISSTLFCAEESRAALDLDEEWLPLGSVAVGPPPGGGAPPRPELDLREHLLFRSDDPVDEVPGEHR
ncbi:MAG: coenzyme F420-0:L-glutamate ligase [Actinomycetota bacterium]|nr:coenzyme F420-0:L-glutamate ligase [Actinomycetota bacterium]